MTEQMEKKTGRPRSEDAHNAIIGATLDLLAEVGVSGMSMEGIAARAGVGKTTIYRRWPDKESLIIDAMVALKGPLPQLPGTSLRDDLLTVAEAAARGRESARNRKMYTCFIGESNRHPELMQRYQKTVLGPRRDLVRNALRQAMDRGELRDDLDLGVMVEVVIAPPLHWMLNHYGESPSPDQIAQFVDSVLDGLRPR